MRILSISTWLQAVSSTVAAGALVGAFLLYGDVRAMQEYIQADAERMFSHRQSVAKLTDIIADHGKLLAQMGTLCAENYKTYERLDLRVVAIEGNRWTSDMERSATESIRREMDRLAREVERNAQRIESLSAELKMKLRNGEL